MLKQWILEIVTEVLTKDSALFKDLYCAMDNEEKEQLFFYLEHHLEHNDPMYEWFLGLKGSQGFPHNLSDCINTFQVNVHIWIWYIVDWAYYNDIELLKRMYYLMNLDESHFFISYMNGVFDVEWKTIVEDSGHIQFLKAQKELTDCFFALNNKQPTPSREMWRVTPQGLSDLESFSSYSLKSYSRYPQVLTDTESFLSCPIVFTDTESFTSCPIVFTDTESFKDTLVVGDTEMIESELHNSITSQTSYSFENRPSFSTYDCSPISTSKLLKKLFKDSYP